MKRIISIAIGAVLVVVSISAFLYFPFKEEPAYQSHNTTNDLSEDVVVNGKSLTKPYISPAQRKSWQKKNDAEMAKEDAKMAIELSNIPVDMDSILSDQRLDSLTKEDLAEIDLMLSKFKSLDIMSQSAIIDTLLGFYAKDHRYPGIREFYMKYYKDLDTLYGNKLTKDQKLLVMIHFTQEKVSNLRDIDIEVAEKMQLREELLKTDPDLYYDAELEDIASEIPETEALISAAEARGDMKSAESHRNHLEALRERIDGLDFERNFDEYIEAMKQELLKDRLPNVESDYHAWVEELIDKTKPDNPSVNPSPIISDESQSPLSLDSVLVSVGEEYLDVVLSRYFTPDELNEFYPTESDKAILGSRTRKMQNDLASHIRRVLDNMKGVSAVDKLKVATKFLNNNYDKEFVSEVLKKLNSSEH